MNMNRRSFLKLSGLVTAQSVFASAAVQSLWTVSARGEEVPLSSLHSALNPDDGVILVPGDAQFTLYQSAFNTRTLKMPLVRVLCLTPAGVATCIQWALMNDVPMATRSGGHSFEGLSQTTGLAIDLRMRNHLEISDDKNHFVTGAGSLLGNIYQALSVQNKTVPAGSCPTVGITGHTLGGGYGLVARAYGLACDSLRAAEIVDADGKILNCSATENADLFWALRGGGAGSFGVVTQLQYSTHPAGSVIVYGLSWNVNAHVAAALMKTWQGWAPNAPREITSLMKVGRGLNGLYSVRAIGQSIGTETQLRAELAHLTKIAAAGVSLQGLPFMGAVHHFGGSFDAQSVFMKGKSDYLKAVMSDLATSKFLSAIPIGIDVIFDSYGGAIRDHKDTDMAFAHRSNTLSSLQYYTQWGNASQGVAKLAAIRTFHDAMRPYMSGSAYFNYCDLDIKDYATAYWGDNLPQLMDVKAKYDPKNVFRHAQSIPVKG